MPWTQMKVPSTWRAGSSSTPVHAEGLISHSSGEGERRGRGLVPTLNDGWELILETAQQRHGPLPDGMLKPT